MNEVEKKRASMAKEMKVEEQALGKIDKKMIKLTWENEEKKAVVQAAAAILEKAKSTKDEVPHQ